MVVIASTLALVALERTTGGVTLAPAPPVPASTVLLNIQRGKPVNGIYSSKIWLLRQKTATERLFIPVKTGYRQ